MVVLCRVVPASFSWLGKAWILFYLLWGMAMVFHYICRNLMSTSAHTSLATKEIAEVDLVSDDSEKTRPRKKSRLEQKHISRKGSKQLSMESFLDRRKAPKSESLSSETVHVQGNPKSPASTKRVKLSMEFGCPIKKLGIPHEYFYLPLCFWNPRHLASLDFSSLAFNKFPLDNCGSSLSYESCFLEPHSESKKAFSELQSSVPWTQGSVTVYNKTHQERRLTAFYALNTEVGYSYSGRKVNPIPLESPETPMLIRSLFFRVSEFCGVEFNSCLLNYYRSGDDYIGFHSDDEKLYGGSPTIAAVTVGTARDFVLKPRPSLEREMARKQEMTSPDMKTKCESLDSFKFSDIPKSLKFFPASGSLFVMEGKCQHFWHHGLPVRKKGGPRISLTFRKVVI